VDTIAGSPLTSRTTLTCTTTMAWAWNPAILATRTVYVKKLAVGLADLACATRASLSIPRATVRGRSAGCGQLVQYQRRWLGRAAAGGAEPFVDAYFWIKVPGESDGTSDLSQPASIRTVRPLRAPAARRKQARGSNPTSLTWSATPRRPSESQTKATR